MCISNQALQYKVKTVSNNVSDLLNSNWNKKFNNFKIISSIMQYLSLFMLSSSIWTKNLAFWKLRLGYKQSFLEKQTKPYKIKLFDVIIFSLIFHNNYIKSIKFFLLFLHYKSLYYKFLKLSLFLYHRALSNHSFSNFHSTSYIIARRGFSYSSIAWKVK